MANIVFLCNIGALLFAIRNVASKENKTVLVNALGTSNFLGVTDMAL
jgi:hypothetical protein